MDKLPDPSLDSEVADGETVSWVDSSAVDDLNSKLVPVFVKYLKDYKKLCILCKQHVQVIYKFVGIAKNLKWCIAG